MGTCKVCGQDAGWFKSSHYQCEVKFNELVLVATKAALNTNTMEQLTKNCRSIAKEYQVSDASIRGALIVGWEKALEQLLEEGIPSKDAEDNLMNYASELKLSQLELDRKGQYTRAGQVAVLRDILEGIVPQRIKITGNTPFNLQKDETLVWLFHNVSLYEEKTIRSYEGRSHGFSVRIARGLYYKTGIFKSWPVETTLMMNKGVGSLGVTTKHIYFAGLQKSLRLPYKKIIHFIPYSDGVGIHTDVKSDKPIAFMTGDGWFINNLVQNLAQM
jgi:hypothetical protein